MSRLDEAIRPVDHDPAAPRPDGRRRIAIFIDHDIVYRHFVHSGAFATLCRRHAVTFVFPTGAGNKRVSVKPNSDELGASFESIPIDQPRLFQWRRLFQVSQLRWRPGAEWRQLRRITRHFIGRKPSLVYGTMALPGLFSLFQRWSLWRIEQLPSSVGAVLARLRPDVIIHPTVLDGYFINDLILLGRRMRIPIVAIMNSWDNPSTKRAVVGLPDWVLVWGPQTQAHAVRYMGMNPGRAISFGAAQFDVYRRPPRVTREEFCRAHGIDPGKRILLYAGSSKGADEFAHLRMIEEAIDRGELANLAVVYRPHPWGHGGYKGERLLEHSWRHVVIERSMRRYLEDVHAGRRGAHLADYADTHDVLSSVDVLVSPLSTIILEGGLHGKPVLCFFPEQKEGSSFGQQAALVHFDDMYRCPAILMAHGEASFIAAIAQLVGRIGDDRFAETLRTACAHFVTPFDRSFADRVVDFVEQTVADPSEVVGK